MLSIFVAHWKQILLWGIVAGLLVGCGGQDNPGPQPTPSYTPAAQSGEVQAAASRSMSAAASREYATSCGVIGRTGATRE